MLLIIDNYDSFTYNLVHYFQILGQEVIIFKNDCHSIAEIEALSPHYLVISPGPNSPQESGISLEVISHFYKRIPILGVCLGHQCLAAAFGASIVKADQVIHGKTSPIIHQQRGLFRELPSPFQATRYHSLAIEEKTLPDCFTIDAWAENTIMAISHRQLPLFGLQFHPEAILSEYGMQLLTHFLAYEYRNIS